MYFQLPKIALYYCQKQQERFTRAKTIGENYTEDNIKRRIENRVSRKEKHPIEPKSYDAKLRNNPDVDKVIDIKNNIKVQSFKGYKIWAKQHNLKNMAKTLNLMSIHQISSRDELYNAIGRENIALTNISTDIKNIEKDMEKTSLKIKNIETYIKLKSVYSAYQISKDKESFYKTHANEIILFEAANAALGDTVSEDIVDTIPILKRALKQRILSKEKSFQEYQKQKEKVSQLNFLKSNLVTYMQWQEPEIKQKREH